MVRQTSTNPDLTANAKKVESRRLERLTVTRLTAGPGNPRARYSATRKYGSTVPLSLTTIGFPRVKSRDVVYDVVV